jgi:hypothetical protein
MYKRGFVLPTLQKYHCTERGGERERERERERSWGSAVGIVTMIGAGHFENSYFDIREGQRVLVFCKLLRPTLGPTQLPFQWITDALYPTVKWPGLETHRAAPINVDINPLKTKRICFI